MRLGKNFHTWVQTISTAVQALAVFGGVIFAIIQISDAQSERTRERRVAALTMLQEMEQEPFREAAKLVAPHPQGDMVSWVTDGMDAEEFSTATEPIRIAARNLSSCVLFQVCDREVVGERICPVVADYLTAVRRRNLSKLDELRLIFRDNLHYLRDVCSKDYAIYEAVNEMMSSAADLLRKMQKPVTP